MRDPTEVRLINRCRAGDAEAWDEAFDRYYAPTYRFVFQLGFHLRHEDVEEICQETFLSVIRSLKSFKAGSAFQTWIFRIAANKARDALVRQSALKRGGGEPPLSLNAQDPVTGLTLDPPDAAQAPDTGMIAAEQLALVQASVVRLDPPCREIVQLRYFAELSYEELAATLGLHPKTVSSRLSRCLDRLEDIVKEAFASENFERFSV